jgi:hypothetical protein
MSALGTAADEYAVSRHERPDGASTPAYGAPCGLLQRASSTDNGVAMTRRFRRSSSNSFAMPWPRPKIARVVTAALGRSVRGHEAVPRP